VSWLKIDDRFLDHPKVVRLERLAPSRGVHLFVGLMSYCKQRLSDGVVPIDMLPKVNGPCGRWRQRTLEALIEVGLVERSGEQLVIHDYLDWNPSKEEIERKAADRKAMADKRRKDLERASQQHSDRKSIASRSQVDNGLIASRSHGDRHAVSNDVVPLDAPESDTVSRARALTETETETEIRSKPPDTPLALEPSADPTPTQIASTSSAKAGKRSKAPRARTLCPIDFEPDETTQAKATSLGFTPKLELETREGFVDWWRGKGLLQADWQATYRNWLRKDAKSRGLKPPVRDARWAEHQAAKRAAEAPLKRAVPKPRDFDAKAGNLFA
jgi:hypothetical protein